MCVLLRVGWRINKVCPFCPNATTPTVSENNKARIIFFISTPPTRYEPETKARIHASILHAV